MMMMVDENVLVSIVTPCYNSVQFIEQCIQSVLAQDYSPPIEHIVQDAASTDGTVEILKRYTGQVDWVSEPDTGQSDGLNRALQRCHGEIIGVLNADDEYLPYAVSWAVQGFSQFPQVAVIYGDQYTVDSKGRIFGKIHGQEYDFAKIFCVENVIPAQAAFIKRTCFDQVGLFADITRKTCPDYEMWVRIGLKFPMQYIPGIIAKYRSHSGSEGCQTSIILKMVKSKREVMERVFSDPATPDSIMRLQQRAYSGVVWWGACTIVCNGNLLRGISKFFRSLWIAPSIEQIPRVLSFLMYLEFYFQKHQKTQKIWNLVRQIIEKGLFMFERGCWKLGIRRRGQYGP